MECAQGPAESRSQPDWAENRRGRARIGNVSRARGEEKTGARAVGCRSRMLDYSTGNGTRHRGGPGRGNATHRAGTFAGTRDYLSKFAGSLFEIAGSKPAEDSFSRFGSA